MIRLAAAAAFLAAMAMPGVTMAMTQYGQMMMRYWSASDRCAAAAQRAFPDHTPEANAKRDANMKQCLAQGSLPPRGDLDRPKP